MHKRIIPLTLGLGLLSLSGAALAATVLVPLGEHPLSDGSGEQTPDMDKAAKVKLMRLSNGMLVSVFGDGAGDDVYDAKKDAERPARDIFARTCQSKSTDCSDLNNWSAAVNVSRTAGLSSMDAAWQGGDEPVSAYAGDSEKPNIFKVGSTLVVSWVDHYCPGGEQGSVVYVERDEREIPFACTYVSVSKDAGSTWSAPQQLSSGARDAKQDVNRGSDKGWVVTWQEDPVGLQLGSGDGPGDGASGANTSKGTDIWYSWITAADLAAGEGFSEPVRLTDNFTKMDREHGGSTDVESGLEGAARANLFMVGGTVQVAWEETKGSQGTDSGKVIRYTSFPFNTPPTSCVEDLSEADGCAREANGEILPAQDDPVRMGCILSDPAENARRVRFFSQGTPGAGSGARTFLFWKQGLYDEGGPSDIIARQGIAPVDDTDPMAGFRPQDLWPQVALPSAEGAADGCYSFGDEDLGTGAHGNTPGMNLSSNTEVGGSLDEDTEANNLEDARAHRGFIKGDLVVLGYSYTPDWAVARYTDQENYAFWVRVSADGGETWGAPQDVSSAALDAMAAELGLEPEGINVKEPRIVKTPGNGPGCPTGDPGAEDTTDTSDCSAGGTFLVAFGSETNVYEMQGGNQDLDVFVFRSLDKGSTYELAGRLSDDLDASEDGESQLQITPNGHTVYAAWFSAADGHTDAMFSVLEPQDVPDTGDTGEPQDTDTDEPEDSDLPVDTDEPVEPEPEGCGGCSSNGQGGGGLAFALMALGGMLVLRRRR